MARADIRNELRAAITMLSMRGLVQSSKWCSELLLGLVEQKGCNWPDVVTNLDYMISKNSCETDIYLIGKSLFDSREYLRCCSILERHDDGSNPLVTFLRGYAQYLAGEKRKDEERHEKQNPMDTENQELIEIRKYLENFENSDQLDAFGLYLLGIIYSRQNTKSLAKKILLRSITKFPYNWSAWMELSQVCNDAWEAQELELPKHWMSRFFLASISMESNCNENALNIYEELEQFFSNSLYVKTQKATALYNLRNFDKAQELFEENMAADPMRLDGIDTYSNILYVKEMKPELSYLARNCIRVDKYRPETCCIIGNYYSLRQQHEQAVIYFQRALKLNGNYLSAWTLMGHEYVEMKNTAAAVEAYRRAVDINARDYRAWYGLGQTYELLSMPKFTLYYYRKATMLRPYDPRMWCAMGQCYQELQRSEDAIQCYKQAIRNGDRDGIAVSRLACLYVELDEHDQAAHYYEIMLGTAFNDAKDDHIMKNDEEVEEPDDVNFDVDNPEVAEALLFLARYNIGKKDYARADYYASKLLDSAGSEKDHAKAILREIYSIQNV